MMGGRKEWRKEQRKERGNKSSHGKVICTEGKRAAAIAAGIALAVAGAAGGYRAAMPVEREQEQTLYSYQVTADAGYRVHLLPNDLYGEEWMEEGLVYSELLVDYIQVALEAGLSGTGTAAVSGAYEVTAVLEGYQAGAEARKQVYERRFPLREGKVAQTAPGQASVEEILQVRPADYRQYVTQAETILGGSTDKDFYLLFEGTFQVEAGGKTDEKKFSYRISFPLGEGSPLFAVGKQDRLDEKGEITQLVPVREELPRALAAGSGAACLAGLASVLWALFGVRLPDEREAWKLRMAAVLRKYGSRMVCVEKLPHTAGKEILYLKGIESLFTTAEELRQPVFYALDAAGLPKDGSFSVPHGEQAYLFHDPEPAVVPTTKVVDGGDEKGS